MFFPKPEPWMKDAICVNTDPEAFYPEKGGSAREAKKVCTGCPARVACLEFAIRNNERWGIWGAKSERERRKIAGKAHPSEVAA